MSDDVFDVKILTEKLSKLNNSQQSIESLSRWCIFHRKKARPIVETWERSFNSSPKEQCVSFLYLANDILQNSRRKGGEYVNEFWKVLPAALKNVYEHGDEHGRKTVLRLVDIWEERKVFGSRGQSLKDEMLGKDPPPQSVSSGKNSNPIKIVKKDSQSLRIKLAVGGLVEKIVTAFHYVHEECPTEEDALVKCDAALLCGDRMDKDMENIMAQGSQPGATLLDRLQEQENILRLCVKQLETAEASRLSLVSQLKEALQDQESSLETIHSQLQAACGQIDVLGNIRQTLSSLHNPLPSGTALDASTEPAKVVEHGRPAVQATTGPQIPLNQTTDVLQLPVHQLQPPMKQPATSFAALATTEEENKKAVAAAVAARLAASTSSAQMLTSVLSSLVAEEAAGRNGNLGKSGFSINLPPFSPEKRQKVESEGFNSDKSGSAYVSPHQHPMASLPIVASSGLQVAQMPAKLPPLPPLPPPSPRAPPTSSPANQFVQSAGLMLGPIPYGLTGANLPLPPPLPFAMGLSRAPTQQTQQLQQQFQSQQQQSATGGYYGNLGVLYGQSHRPTTPPVHRQ
ncbi:hypothetical protein Ancab_033221 [Ancistrocladus abbreviatus]